MSQLAWVCSICNKLTAVFFCCCDSVETFLCDSCLGKHYMKTPGRLHQCVPVSVYGQHLVPGYFERLTVRSSNFAKRQADALLNLTTIDTCISEFSSKVDRMIETLITHRTETIAKLQAARQNLEAEIQRAVQEAEDSMYFDTVTNKNYLLDMMRRPETSRNEMSLFQFTISSIAFPLISQILTYKVGQAKGVQADVCIPAVVDSSFVLYSSNGGVIKKSQLPRSCNASTKLVYTGKYVYLLARVPNYRLDCATFELVCIPNMLKNRRSYGLYYQNCVIFVFGGTENYHDPINDCEKFCISEDAWKTLPHMNEKRSKFTPAKLNDDLYLVSDNSITQMESFNLTTEIFTALHISLPACSNIISFFIDDELTVLCLDNSDRYKLKPAAGETVFRMSLFTPPTAKRNDTFPWRNEAIVSPVVTGNVVRWVATGSLDLLKYSADSNILI